MIGMKSAVLCFQLVESFWGFSKMKKDCRLLGFVFYIDFLILFPFKLCVCIKFSLNQVLLWVLSIQSVEVHVQKWRWWLLLWTEFDAARVLQILAWRVISMRRTTTGKATKACYLYDGWRQSHWKTASLQQCQTFGKKACCFCIAKKLFQEFGGWGVSKLGKYILSSFSSVSMCWMLMRHFVRSWYSSFLTTRWQMYWRGVLELAPI